MWSDSERELWLTETLACWLRRRVPVGTTGRRNFRLVCAEVSLAEALQARLDALPEPHVRWFVRPSSAKDAVRLRHGRPDGVGPDVCVAFVLLWSEGSAEADRNAQSLTDLPAFDVVDVLADPVNFELPAEAAIRARCEQAADAWDPAARDRVRAHLVAAWQALRTALRLAPRSPQHPLRLVDSLDAYGRYLWRASVDDARWTGWPELTRAEQLLRHLGHALTELRLFAFPAWANEIGVVTSPPTRPEAPRRTGEDRWDRVVEDMLLENLRWASDHGALSDAIAGNRTVREQIHELVHKRGVVLGASPTAAVALERFCHDGNEEAFADVEWLFHKDPANRRSPSMGISGLLIARGRRQPRIDPVEKLAEDTDKKLGAGLADADRDTLRRLLDQNRRAATGRATIAAVCVELAGGEIQTNGEWRPTTTAIASRPAHAPDEARALADKWMAIDAKQTPRDVEVAPTMLLGLARLLGKNEETRPGDGPGSLLLTLLGTERPDTCQHAFTVDDGLPQALSLWMRERVRDAHPIGDGDEDEDEDRIQSMSFSVARRCAGKDQHLGTVQIEWGARDLQWRKHALDRVPMHRTASWSQAGEPPASVALLKHLHLHGAQKQAGVDELSEPWNAFVREAGLAPDGKAPWTDVLDLIAPIGPAGRAWVDAWAEVIARAAEGRDAEQREAQIAALEVEKDAAFDQEDYARAKLLNAKLRELKAAPRATVLDVKDVRRALQIETSALTLKDSPSRLVLSPHHPLVLRLRILADRILGAVIVELWRGTWPEQVLDELQACLRDWGLPEPQHVYGAGPTTPLVFDGWCAGYAIYATLGSGRDTDAESLGLRAVQDVIARYTKLYPANADRLRLRITGDDAGQWAWGIVAGRARAGQRADIDLVTTLPRRQMTAFENHALASGDDLARFEPGSDGVAPPVRFRRIEDDGGQPGHLSFVLAEHLPQFQAKWNDNPRPGGELSPWDPRLLFHEPRPEAIDYRIQVQEAPDRLSSAVAFAVARACGQQTPISECYNFDPDICSPLLRREQQRADWLVLASRQPAYRAIQACGNVSTLLDFYSMVEGGRPVQVCVSLGDERRAQCVKTLEDACRRLLDGASVDAESLLDRARRLAPGLALRALAASPVALEGLLGLLLTESAITAPGRLVLSLDQHRHLLSGGGSLADLLVLQRKNDVVSVGVTEAKFTVGSAGLTSDPVPRARKQVDATIARLSRFGVAHPLAARTRAALVRAALQQVHLLDRTKSRAELQLLAAIVDGLADPATPILIEPADQAAIHVWSWNASTSDAHAASVHIHGRLSIEASLCRSAS